MTLTTVYGVQIGASTDFFEFIVEMKVLYSQ